MSLTYAAHVSKVLSKSIRKDIDFTQTFPHSQDLFVCFCVCLCVLFVSMCFVCVFVFMCPVENKILSAVESHNLHSSFITKAHT